MRHVYECPMRWADLDLQGHVNNVVYVDYLQEARVDMMRSVGPTAPAGELTEGVVVVRHGVNYRAPLTFDVASVLIECWVTEIRVASFTMAYEIFRERGDGGRDVFLRASTVLTPYVFSTERPRRLSEREREWLLPFLEPEERAPRTPFTESRRLEVGHYPVQTRFSDVDVYGHVNNVKYFEYFQESRIRMNSRLWRDLPDDTTPTSVVVAQTDVDYKIPILFRPEAYDAWSWVSHVGTTSAVIESEIMDGDTLLSRARVVMVFFDAATQRATVPPDAYRDPLVALSQQH